MRIAIVSDIHANRPAWQAVYTDILSRQTDVTVCLGDIIGYGPHPAEVLSDVYACIHDMVIGNHEAVVAGLFDESLFNDEALAMIHSTRELLGSKAQRLFKQMPYVIEEDADGLSIVYTHGALPDPEEFEYVESVEEASGVWKATAADLVFLGHTHVPRYDLLDASGAYESGIPDGPIQLEVGARYIINVGSVGMPRIDDQRACYGMLDTATRVFEHHYVPYDTLQVAEDLRRSAGAGAAMTQNLLQVLEGGEKAAVRDRVDFGRTQRLEDFVTDQGKARSTPRATGPRRKAVQIKRSPTRPAAVNAAGFSKPGGTVQRTAGAPTQATSKAPLFVTVGIVSVVLLILLIVAIARSCKGPPRSELPQHHGQNGAGAVVQPPVRRTLPPVGPDGTRVMVEDDFSGTTLDGIEWDVRTGRARVVDGRMRLECAGEGRAVVDATHKIDTGRGFAVAVDVAGGRASDETTSLPVVSMRLLTGNQHLRVQTQIGRDGAQSSVYAVYKPRADAEPIAKQKQLQSPVARLGFLYNAKERTASALAAGADGKMMVVMQFGVVSKTPFSTVLVLEPRDGAGGYVLLDNFRIKEKVR